MRRWVPQNVRDDVVGFVLTAVARTELSQCALVAWIGISRERFAQWRRRAGRPNVHNAATPRDFWLEAWERAAIVAYYKDHRLEGYRRVAFMMLDADLVATSPSTVYRVLKEAGLMRVWERKASKKGTGFEQPLAAHAHWHVDVTYLNIRGTFYYHCALLDGFSRAVVHWEIREQMTEADVETIVQRARERFPEARPRIISDNGPQFIAREFKEFVRLCGMTHVRTSPYYPQSNGKIEAYHKVLKGECIRPGTPLSLEEARRIVGKFVDHYNCERLHGAIGYITPRDKLQGRAEIIFEERRRKLKAARDGRERRRLATAAAV